MKKIKIRPKKWYQWINPWWWKKARATEKIVNWYFNNKRRPADLKTCFMVFLGFPQMNRIFKLQKKLNKIHHKRMDNLMKISGMRY